MSEKKITRRKFIQGSIAVGVGAAAITGLSSGPHYAKGPGLGPSGIAVVTSRSWKGYRIDLISLRTGNVLKTFDDFFATHAVVPVEHENRFFVHGVYSNTEKGAVLGIQIDPAKETWKEICDKELPGGRPLHWQPNADHSLIAFNTIGNRGLHVLNTKTLKLESFAGGGRHSNMAFFNNDQWVVATDRLRDGTTLRVIDRKTKQILSETETGGWGHGVTVNAKTKRAFVWATHGVHVVDLDEKNLGKHLKLMKPEKKRQRSWFCWTPQGGRYSHDQTWNPGDEFSPWLTVLDTEKDRLKKIEVDNEALGTLGVSPDGKMGMCGSHSSQNVCLFDISRNKFIGKVKAGRGNEGFFDRDVSFSRNRGVAYATNPGDSTMTAIDIKTMKELRTYGLPARPEWMKVITM